MKRYEDFTPRDSADKWSVPASYLYRRSIADKMNHSGLESGAEGRPGREY